VQEDHTLIDPAQLIAEEKALGIQARRLREMAPDEKLKLTSSYSRMVTELADADVRERHPDWSERRIRIEASRRWLPAELHLAAFGVEMDSWNL
jgi:hypothetical protein